MKHSIANAKQRLSSISPHIMEDILLRKNLVASQRFDSAIESIRNSFQKKAERPESPLGPCFERYRNSQP